jgi:hypothetical protein
VAVTNGKEVGAIIDRGASGAVKGALHFRNDVQVMRKLHARFVLPNDSEPPTVLAMLAAL